MREITLQTGDWTILGADATLVRNAVFAREQRIAALFEWDEADLDSLHAVAYRQSADQCAAVATGRLLRDGAIGRLAVLCEARRHGVGSRLLQALIEHASRRGDERVRLYAQCRVMRFYVRHGFVAVGHEFEAAGVAHIEMMRKLV